MQRDLENLDKVARLLDSKFRLPGTPIRFGWDTVVGIVPGLGDAVTLVPAVYLLYKGYQLGARKRTLARMIANTGLDVVLGAIPFLGDIFDTFFKSNLRNVGLLRRDLERQTAAVMPFAHAAGST